MSNETKGPQPPAEAQPVAKLVVEKDGLVKFIRPTGLGLDLPAGEYLLHLHPSPAEAQEPRDREADRARFRDEAFNAWLDTGISDAGHTVWHTIGDLADAWAGWQARPDAPPSAPVGEDALRDARTIYDIACIRAEYANATREDVEFKAIALRNYNFLAQQPAAFNTAPERPHAQGSVEHKPAAVDGVAEAFENYHSADHRDPAVASEWKWWQAGWFAALAAQQGGRSDD